MIRSIRQVFLGAVLLSGTAVCLHAQEAELLGIVRDTSDAAVPKATLKLVNKATGVSRTVQSNGQGAYSFPSVSAGGYDMTVSAQGFQTQDRTGISVNVGSRLQIDFSLKVGEVKEMVEVAATQDMINSVDASSGTVIDRKFVDSIPLNGRSFQTLLELSPGVVMVPTTSTGSDQGQFSVNGQRNNSNYFTVDGVSANFGIPVFQSLAQGSSGSIPSTSIQGGFNNLVSADSLQEFRIETSTFSPEYGRSPGGQIALVTRGGANTLHGSAMEYFRNDKADARNWFDVAKPPLRFNDFGATLGGRIIKDKTFFFVSYEGQRFRLPQPTLITVVPSQSVRDNAPNALIKMMLNAFPIPNGPAVGNDGAYFTTSYSNPNTMDTYSGRIDHHFTDKYSIFGRYNHSPSNSLSRSSSNFSQASQFVQNTETLTIGSVQIFTSHLVNDLRVNGSRQQGQWLNVYDGAGGGVRPDATQLLPNFNTCGACYYLYYIYSLTAANASLGGVTDGATARNQARSINIVDSVSYTVGTHQIKAGFDYRWYSPVQSGNGLILGMYFQNGVSDLIKMTAPLMLISRSPETVLLVHNYSSYVQDAWRVNRRLTLTYGVRWEVNPPPAAGGSGKQIVTLAQPPNLSQLDQSGLQLAPLGTPIYNTSYTRFAPRVGLAYQLSTAPQHELVLRAGWGLFYDLASTPFASGSWPYSASLTLQNQPIPATAAQVALPAINFTPSPTNRASSVGVASPDFTLPRTYQWNVTLEQALGRDQTLTVSYVGAAGRDLLRTLQLNLGTNATTPAAGLYWSPNFSTLTYADNASYSDYNSLQMQFRRRLSKGLQAIANYTWSHATDDSSSGTSITSPGLFYAPSQNHGASNFDVRHSVSGALTYDIPTPHSHPIVNALLRNWSVNTLFTARTGLPFDVKLNEITAFNSSTAFRRADLVAGQPIWLDDPHVPGGKKVNPAAFGVPAAPTGQGSLGRDSISGFGAWQDDFGLHRSFKVTERVRTEFRVEAFNIFNHPNFINPNPNLTYRNGVLTVPVNYGITTQTLSRGYGGGGNTGGFNPLFQTGGPRDMQFALKATF
jgi:hypothetical protein